MFGSDALIAFALGASCFLNILVPISGSATVTPLLAVLTDPHRAIGLASFFFCLSGIVRVALFRTHIQWREVKILLPVSLIAAFFGALSLIALNETLLLLIVLGFTVYFFLKRVEWIPTKKTSTYTVGIIGLLSGFLQGAGLAGSDLRNGYLYGKKFDLAQVHGTTAVIGASNFLLASMVRLWTHQLTVPDLTPLLWLFPFIVVGSLLGRTVIYKLKKETTNAIIGGVMIVIMILLAQKIIATL